MSHTFWLILGLHIFQVISMDTTSEDSCDAEDFAVAQWFSQISHFIQRNENITQHFADIQRKLDQLEHSMAETRKTVAESQPKLEQCLQELKALRQTQQNTNNQPSADIVIQRRMDGSVDFQRTWAEYKTGFGNSSGEFFIGLDKLHKLTNSRPYELLIVMEDWSDDRRYASYDRFIVGSEAEKYALKQLGSYRGSAGDSLTYHLGQKFSTKDQDNDAAVLESCAVTYTGAWWHNACHHSNLNGQYLKGTITQFAVGTHWLAFKGYYYSLKFVEMLLRPS